MIDDIRTVKQCESVLRAVGPRKMNVFAVTLIRGVDSIRLADDRYEEALVKAEEFAFEQKVAEYRNLEEWQYDALTEDARREVDSVLAEWKRKQCKKSTE